MCEARNPFEQFAAFALASGSVTARWPRLTWMRALASPAEVVVMQQARPDRPLLVRYRGTVRRQLVMWRSRCRHCYTLGFCVQIREVASTASNGPVGGVARITMNSSRNLC